MYIACGSYGATFTGRVYTREAPLERVILKIAWDDQDAIDSFERDTTMRVTTPEGVKPFDRFVVREAIVTRLLAALARSHN